MRITGVTEASILPPHVAKAYGVQPHPTAHVAQVRGPDTLELSVNAKRLIAGSVSQPVNFEAQAPALHALRMYARAADQVEAAVSIQLGRTIDVKA